MGMLVSAPAWGGGELVGAECDSGDPRQSQCHPFISAGGVGCGLSSGRGTGGGGLLFVPVLSEAR